MTIHWEKKEIEVEPYSKLAFIYDAVMYHVNYQAWSKYIHQILDKWHPSTRRLIDIGCGTGSLLVRMSLDQSLKLYGFDNSLEMARRARKKILERHLEIPVWMGNMNQYRLHEPVDVILCLYDSFNYLRTSDEIQSFFQSADDSLKTDGLLIFDICTRKNSLKHFDNYFESDRGKDYEYERKSKFDHKTSTHRNFFKINFDKSDIIFVEYHQQRIYYLYEMFQEISKTKFEIKGVLNDFSFKPASEDSIRAHFVLKKVQ